MPRKRIYAVLYAQDVPQYGHFEIEAASDKHAIARAKAEDLDSLYFDDPEYGSPVCRRISQIEDEDGNCIAEDIALDPYYMMDGAAVPRRLCEHALELLEALKALNKEAAQSEIAFSIANLHARSVIAKAEGRS